VKSSNKAASSHFISDTLEFFREYRLWVFIVIACVIASWLFINRQGEVVPASNIDPFSGPLVIDAPGCVMTAPDGSSIKDSIRGKGEFLIPAGTRFNGDCFPAAKEARAAGIKK
jgi:hypothetical protein